jgi:hypothetical protein
LAALHTATTGPEAFLVFPVRRPSGGWAARFTPGIIPAVLYAKITGESRLPETINSLQMDYL